jgi:hypothetical protein
MTTKLIKMLRFLIVSLVSMASTAASVPNLVGEWSGTSIEHATCKDLDVQYLGLNYCMEEGEFWTSERAYIWSNEFDNKFGFTNGVTECDFDINCGALKDPNICMISEMDEEIGSVEMKENAPVVTIKVNNVVTCTSKYASTPVVDFTGDYNRMRFEPAKCDMLLKEVDLCTYECFLGFSLKPLKGKDWKFTLTESPTTKNCDCDMRTKQKGGRLLLQRRAVMSLERSRSDENGFEGIFLMRIVDKTPMLVFENKDTACSVFYSNPRQAAQHDTTSNFDPIRLSNPFSNSCRLHGKVADCCIALSCGSCMDCICFHVTLAIFLFD